MPTTKFQAIAGDARVGYVVIELVEFSFRLGVEDNAVLHCLFGFRLLRVMTRLEPRKNCLDRDALSLAESCRSSVRRAGTSSRNHLSRSASKSSSIRRPARTSQALL
ncbi:hypothetical protein X766_34325 [Mesorhizobium sp. LSJC255A00]|nr:hypothetical protein X766_34325 [Mesorhizobium sp. LSJC255A00]